MKCIKCGTDNNRRDWNQNSGKCKRCGHLFVFEPIRYGSNKLTDSFFAKAITQISANNTLYFTVGQFQYFVARQLISDTKPRITESRRFAINNISFTYCLFISYGLFFFYTILNVVTRLIIANNISGFIALDLKLFLFLVTSLLACSLNIKFSSNSSFSDAVRCKRLQGNLNTTNQLIKDALLLIVGVIFSQLFYSVDNSIILLGMIAILLGRHISIVAMYLGDVLKVNNVVTQVTKTIYNPGLNEQETVRLSLEKWQRINGVIPKLIPNFFPQFTSVITPGSDVTAYSFDRLVVCDNDSIAKFLIANNFHFERNCAILSITGYPQNIFDITMQMLRRNPDLQVYALHNCSPQGLSLIYQLRTDERWFRDSNVTIIDVGILPRQIFNARKIWIKRLEALASHAKSLPTEIQQSLNSAELTWLMEGNSVDLESLQPQKLIHILNQSMATNQNLAFDDHSLMIDDESSNTYFYANIESFG